MGLSKIGAWGAITTAIGYIGKALAAIGTTVGVIVALIIIYGFAIYRAWKENFMGMKKTVGDIIEGIKDFFLGFVDFFEGAIDFIVGIFTLSWDKIKRGFWDMINGLNRIVKGFVRKTINTIWALVTGLIQLLKMVIIGWKNIFTGFYHWLVGGSLIPKLVNEVIDWFWKIPNAVLKMFRNLGRRIKNTLENIIPDWIEDVIKGNFSIPTFGFGGPYRSFQKGGIVPKTGPYLLHQGETVTPNEKGSIVINQTNNIAVSDKREMERMIDDNNTKLVNNVKRQIKI